MEGEGIVGCLCDHNIPWVVANEYLVKSGNGSVVNIMNHITNLGATPATVLHARADQVVTINGMPEIGGVIVIGSVMMIAIGGVIGSDTMIEIGGVIGGESVTTMMEENGNGKGESVTTVMEETENGTDPTSNASFISYYVLKSRG